MQELGTGARDKTETVGSATADTVATRAVDRVAAVDDEFINITLPDSPVRLSPQELEKQADQLKQTLREWSSIPWVASLVNDTRSITLSYSSHNDSAPRLVLTSKGFTTERTCLSFGEVPEDTYESRKPYHNRERLVDLLFNRLNYEVLAHSLYTAARSLGIEPSETLLLPNIKKPAEKNNGLKQLQQPREYEIAVPRSQEVLEGALNFTGTRYFKPNIFQGRGVFKVTGTEGGSYLFESNCAGVCERLNEWQDSKIQRAIDFLSTAALRIKRLPKQLFTLNEYQYSPIAYAKVTAESQKNAADILGSLLDSTRNYRAYDAINIERVKGVGYEFRLVFQKHELSYDRKPELTGHYAKASRATVAGGIGMAGWGVTTEKALERMVRKRFGKLSTEELQEQVQSLKNSLIDTAEAFGRDKKQTLDYRGRKQPAESFALDVAAQWNEAEQTFDWYLIEENTGKVGIKGMKANRHLYSRTESFN